MEMMMGLMPHAVPWLILQSRRRLRGWASSWKWSGYGLGAYANSRGFQRESSASESPEDRISAVHGWPRTLANGKADHGQGSWASEARYGRRQLCLRVGMCYASCCLREWTSLPMARVSKHGSGAYGVGSMMFDSGGPSKQKGCIEASYHTSLMKGVKIRAHAVPPPSSRA